MVAISKYVSEIRKIHIIVPYDNAPFWSSANTIRMTLNDPGCPIRTIVAWVILTIPGCDGQTQTDRRRRNLSELVGLQRAAYQAMMTPTRCKNARMDESADVRIILTAVLQWLEKAVLTTRGWSLWRSSSFSALLLMKGWQHVGFPAIKLDPQSILLFH